MSIRYTKEELQALLQQQDDKVGQHFIHNESGTRYLVFDRAWSTDLQKVVLHYCEIEGAAKEDAVTFVRDASVFNGEKFTKVEG